MEMGQKSYICSMELHYSIVELHLSSFVRLIDIDESESDTTDMRIRSHDIALIFIDLFQIIDF